MHLSGIEAFVHLLEQAGIPYVFGNPGTSELPLCDALVGRSRPQYILGLQEVPVMAMADGYAMASGRVGVVNLHISPGLGNAMGMLYNAYREGTPLLITAGQQDRRLEFEEPILVSDLVRVARIAARIGVADSARYVRKNRGVIGAVLRRRAFRPDPLLRALASLASDPGADVRGIHLFTFNQVEAAAAWQARALAPFARSG